MKNKSAAIDMRASIAEIDKEIILMDDYDDCIIGMCVRCGQEPIAIYSKKKVIEKLINAGCEPEMAEEHFCYNQLGAWMGPKTYAFLVEIGDE